MSGDLWGEGFRGVLYLLDDSVSIPIDRLQISTNPVESTQYLANVALVPNRPKPFRTAIPPDKITKRTFTINIESGLNAAAMRQVARLVDYPLLIPVCPWIRVVEWFTWPATVAGRKLKTWRQSALAGVPEAFRPADAATDHAAVQRTDGTTTAVPTVSGSPDAYGHQEWTHAGSPAADDQVEIEYSPLFLCWLLPGSESMPGQFQHQRQITLVEV